MQNRVNLALPQLPTAVTQLGVSVQKKSSSIMMLIGVFGKGDRYSSDYVANYANVYVLDALKRVDGAGQAQIMGIPDQAMRIWMNPDRMASLGITTSDIANAIKAQNALFGAGQIGQQPSAGPVELTFPVVTQAPFTDPRQYEQIILRASQDGSAIVRLGDVARAEVGLKQYIVDARLNGTPTTFIAVYLQPGANGLKVSAAVRKTLADMKSRFPEGMDYVVSLDTNDFVKLSIEEVIHTLLEAVVLVVLIVYLFLQSFRTTIICLVAIIVSLIATFAGMLALGFSINLITLFGLVLAIGIVVDDAIVVVENVERNMHEHHLPPKEATIKSMGEIAGSLVAVVLVMASVFVPAAFLPGTTGQLYKQFAITIVVSVAVSGFVALTLTPAMSALMLKHSPPKQRGFFAWFNRQVDAVTRGFGHAVELVIKQWIVALVLFAVFLYSIYHLFTVLPTSLRAERGSGLRDGGDHHAGGGEHRPHAGGGREGGRDLRQDLRGRDTLDDHRLQPARQRLQDQLRRLLRDAQGFQGAVCNDRSRKDAECSCGADDAVPRSVGDRAGYRHSDRAAADSRHRHDGRLRVLDPGHRCRRSGAARRGDAGFPQEGAHAHRARESVLHVSRQYAAVARQCRPRQGDAARRSRRGRLQRDPGAVRLADGEPVQPVQPRVVGDRRSRTQSIGRIPAT